MLNTVLYDGPAGVPLLIAHGLFGSARNWNVIAKRLSEARPVVVVDMRNHGSSPWFDTQSYADMASDLSEIIDEQYDVLGHSMGGKAAMMLALNHPEKVRKLVVADISPVGYSHSQLGPIDAMRGVDLRDVKTRADVALQLVGLEAGVDTFLLQSLDLKKKKWKLNLDVLADQMDFIVGFPEVEKSFEGDTLFLSGATSNYVLAEHRPRIKELFPAARFAKIPQAGHWLHAEKPREFEAAVSAFLAM